MLHRRCAAFSPAPQHRCPQHRTPLHRAPQHCRCAPPPAPASSLTEGSSQELIEPRVATAGGSTGAGRGSGIPPGLRRSGDLRSREKGHCSHWWYWERRSSASITPCLCIFTHSLAVMLLVTLQCVASPVQRRVGPSWQEVPWGHRVHRHVCSPCSCRMCPRHHPALNVGCKTQDKRSKTTQGSSRNFIDDNKVFWCLSQEGGTLQARYSLALPETTV